LEVVPAKTSAKELLEKNPDGIFLSNGPGDPAAVAYAIETVRDLVKNFHKPIFGICLGHQILALAMGAKTYKMKFGHRGANQPIKNLSTSKIEIASHNHGFAVSKEKLPETLEITHLNINDDTIAGIKMKTRDDVFSVQYHPEASPGPHDSDYLFEEFLALVRSTSSVTIS
jgi:carbamoyl-phosphate synthase small subunit